jgi:hypothetical protein
VLLVLSAEVQAGAVSFHSFDVEEIFSTADGLVQFVELRETEGLAGQFHFAEIFMTVDEGYYQFGSDLPSSDTAFRHVLIATAGFQQLCGITPDYYMPQGFMNVAGDTVAIRETLESPPTTELTFVSGELPLDGVNALLSDGTVAVNSPTNYWGETCTLNLPARMPAASSWALAALAVLLTAAGAGVIWRARCKELA